MTTTPVRPECPLCHRILVFDGTDLAGCEGGDCEVPAIRDALGWMPSESTNVPSHAPVPPSDHRATVQRYREEVFEACRTLARAERILDELRSLLPEVGLVGEDNNALLIYLAATSRLLDNPVSVAVKGPSSGGKSWTVERVLLFFPEEAYHALSANV